MKKRFLLPFLFLILFVSSIFGRIIFVDNVCLNYFQTFFLCGNAVLFCLGLIPIFTIIASLIFLKKMKINGYLCIFSLISLIIIIFSGVFLEKLVGYKLALFDFSGYVLIFLFLVMTIYYFAIFQTSFKISVKEIVSISLLLAFAVILDFKIFKIPVQINGGSISFTMLPLIIISLRYGPLKGFIASGIIYGFITCAFDGYGYVYFPFDYLLGYGSLFVFGFLQKMIFNKKIFKEFILLFLMTLIAFSMRTLASTISGIIFYNLNFVSSLIYQMTYLPLSFAACLIGLYILYIPLCSLKKKYS